MKKKFLCAALALLLCVALPVTAFAEDFRIGPLAVEKGTIAVGETTTVTAAFQGDQKSLPEGTTVQWFSADDTRAAVAAKGDFAEEATVTGVGAGQVEIYAALVGADGKEDKSSKSAVTVSVTEKAADGEQTQPAAETTPPAEEQTQGDHTAEQLFLIGPLVIEEETIKVGESTNVFAAFQGDKDTLPEGTTVEWFSSDSGKAEVSTGSAFDRQVVVTGIAPGEGVIISAMLVGPDGTPDEYSLTTISVNVEADPAGQMADSDFEIAALTPEKDSIYVGESATVTATFQGDPKTLPEGTTIVWSVNDGKYASVAAASDFAEEAVVMGVAPTDAVVVTATLTAPDGTSAQSGVQASPIKVESNSMSAWIWVLVAIVGAIVVLVVIVAHLRRKSKAQEYVKQMENRRKSPPQEEETGQDEEKEPEEK